MPISVIWDDEEHTIVRYIFDGEWQWREFMPIIDQAAAMTRSVPYRVDTIADLTKSAGLPMRNSFPTLKHLAGMSPDNALLGIFVVVGGGTFVQSLGATFKRVYPMGSPTYFAQTLADAYAVINEKRAQ